MNHFLNRNCSSITSHLTSDSGIIQNYKDDEETVADGEHREESVEGVSHGGVAEDKAGYDVAEKTK